MKIGTVLRSDPGYPEETDVHPAVEFNCKLFPDRVIGRLYMLRRQELKLKGLFFCDGCFMDRIISKQCGP
jgi:hypothetical protein